MAGAGGNAGCRWRLAHWLPVPTGMERPRVAAGGLPEGGGGGVRSSLDAAARGGLFLYGVSYEGAVGPFARFCPDPGLRP